MSFQVHGLPAARFESLFSLSDADLAARGARRMIADAKPGYPCRVSLADAEVGETVILTNFEHQPGDSPYRAAHAIFIREHAEQQIPDIGAIPEVLRIRLISVRAFDDRDFMLDADVVHGADLSEAIQAMFSNPQVAYLHLHNAKPGCFAASVTRA